MCFLSFYELLSFFTNLVEKSLESINMKTSRSISLVLKKLKHHVYDNHYQVPIKERTKIKPHTRRKTGQTQKITMKKPMNRSRHWGAFGLSHCKLGAFGLGFPFQFRFPSGEYGSARVQDSSGSCLWWSSREITGRSSKSEQCYIYIYAVETRLLPCKNDDLICL